MPDGADAFFFSEIDTTNAEAARYAAGNAGSPTWFIAEKQTSGRGRRGRQWQSPVGNLYCSYLFSPRLKQTEYAGLPFAVALAVRDCCIELGVGEGNTRCKWPNDVLINDKKTSGILIEASGSGANAQQIIIGIGINLINKPESAQFPATSLYEETGKKHSIKFGFSKLAQCLHDRLTQWETEGVAGIAQDWRKIAWGMGQQRLIRTIDQEYTATLLALESDGGLKVRLDDGTEKSLYAADIFGAAT